MAAGDAMRPGTDAHDRERADEQGSGAAPFGDRRDVNEQPSTVLFGRRPIRIEDVIALARE